MKTLLPHADPMILLDKVISVTEDSLCAEVVIRSDSMFCDEMGVGAWIGIEYMAQTIAAYAGYTTKEVKIGFLVGTRKYECTKSFFSIGSILHISARCILQADNGLSSFECSIHEKGIQIASAIINTFLPENIEEMKLNE